MMTKFMNKQRGLLAAIMALVMVFAGAAFVAAEADADTPTIDLSEGNLPNAVDGVVKLTENLRISNFPSKTSGVKTIDLAGYELAVINSAQHVALYSNIISTGEKGTLFLGNAFYIYGDVQLNNNVELNNIVINSSNAQAVEPVGANLTMIGCSFTGDAHTALYINDYTSTSKYTYSIDNCNLNQKTVTYTSDKDSVNEIKATLNIINTKNVDIAISSSTGTGAQVVDIGNDITFDEDTTVNSVKLQGQYGAGGMIISEPISVEKLVVSGDNLTIDGDSDISIETLEGTCESLRINGTGAVSIQNGGEDVGIIVGEYSELTTGNGYIGSVNGVDVSGGSANVDTFEKAKDAFAGVNDVVLGSESNSVAYLSTPFTVPEGKTLTIKNTTVYNYAATIGAVTEGSIEVLGTLYLESADVRASITTSGDDAEIIVTKAKKMTVTGDSTADLGVGYGNTLVLADLTVPAGKYIEAWGTVIIEGTVTVQSNNGFHVYQGGYAQIDGALVIEGTATIDGEAVVNGSVKVYNADGEAGLTINGDVTVLGTMDILKPKTKGADNNVLTVGQYGDLDVEGTLTVTGKLVGKVCDMGTIVFNGVADNAIIAVYDGVTLTIAAVDGDLTITDDGIVDVAEYNTSTGYYVSLGNDVVLNDIKNVTVSVTLDETAAKDSTGKSIRLIASEMTVTGTISAFDDAVDGTVDISAATASAEYDADKTVQGTVTIGDITLGKLVVIDIQSENVTVAGTVNVAAQGSDLDVTGDIVIDVTGTIINVTGGNTSAATIEIDGKFNGSSYEVVDADMNYTYYYTTFENAVAAIADAYENVIEVSGEVEVTSALEIPAGAELLMGAGDIMNIDVDGKLTIAADALLEASSAEIDVDGMLVIMDKESGLNAPAKDKFSYQVYTVDGETETYSGLVLALKNASAGDVITVVGTDGTIEKSITIPEGVTLEVPKNTKLTIGDSDDATNDVVLTVNGTLKVSGEVVGVNSAEIVTNGIVIAADEVNSIKNIEMDDYVEFTMKVDGRNVHVHSNLAYAAENAVDGQIRIVGDISGGDVTFTQSDKGTLSILVDNGSTLTVGTLTLIGNGAIFTANGETTGTIAAAAGSVDLDKVSGVVVSVIINEDVDGTTDVVAVKGTLAGEMTVATGTVTVDANDITIGTTKDDVLAIADDATLLVPADAAVIVKGAVAAADAYDALVVDGTLAIDAGAITADATSKILVNGTMTVADNQDAAVAGELTVLGTLDVISTDDEKALLKVSKLVLGTAPALGANGVLSGPIDIDGANAYVIAYAGADVSAALIDVVNDVSTAKSTEIVINGIPYMTVYVDKSSDLTLADFETFVSDEAFVPGVTWESPAADGTKIGEVASAEGTMEATERTLVVSAGVGLQVYIDGLAVANFDGKITVGTHTVSFAVESGYDGSAATITVNGVQVSNNGTFTVDVDDKDVVIIASGAVPAQSGSTVVVDEDDGMALTDILLIVLVVLIVIMAIIVALRMMRS